MLMPKTHKCDTCTKEPATCDANEITWGIDIDPSAKGKERDRVAECDAYTPDDPTYIEEEEQDTPYHPFAPDVDTR